ncbi:MAG TPA: molecular chaperone TorD family protein [Myxococcales bacterium]|nr:molecular chaperone TorD family protein [Myxococcales bacterium]
MDRAACELFAELFAYPRGGTAEQALQCLARVQQPELGTFAAWAQRAPQGEIEEAFCAAFDLSPQSAPYVGEQLCEEPAQRGLFLAHLNGIYAAEGFAPREELPDHFSEVLRFAAVTSDEGARQELLRDGLLPAAARVASSLSGPYRALVEALRGALS